MRLGGRLVVLALVLAGASVRLPAQQNSCLTRTVPVNVWTDKEQLVKGLTAADFRAKFRGRPVEIVSSTYDTGPRRILILLDTSGSMVRDAGKWKCALAVAETLVSASQDSFALLTFTQVVQTRIDFSKGRQAVVDGLAGLEQQHWKDYEGPRKTALLDAIESGLGLFGALRDGDTMYLISDGEDNASHTTESRVRSMLLSSGVRLFALLPNALMPWGRTLEDGIGPETFEKFVEATGGDYVNFTPGEDIPGYRSSPLHYEASNADRAAVSWASHSLAREIDEFYRLTLKLPEPVDKPRGWQLDVIEPATGREVRHLRIIYPQKLAPCP